VTTWKLINLTVAAQWSAWRMGGRS